MRRRWVGGRGLVLVAALGIAAASLPGWAGSRAEPEVAAKVETPAERPAVREIMAKAATSLGRVYGRSLTPGGLFAGKATMESRSDLRSLREASDQLSAHLGVELDATYRAAVGRLQRDTRVAEDALEKRDERATRAALRRVTDVCMDCHSRHPSASSPLGAQILEKVDLDAVPGHERARLFAVMRQYDDAMTTFEGLLGSSASVRPDAVQTLVEDYLAIALRVRESDARALRTLTTLSEREDLGPGRQSRFKVWAGFLDSRAAATDVSDPTRNPVALYDTARARTRYVGDPGGRIYDIAASAALYDALRSSCTGAACQSRAYAMLGKIRLHDARPGAWDASADLLESAIVSDPAGDTALEAYKLLTEIVYPAGSIDMRLQAENQWITRHDELGALLLKYHSSL